VRPSSQRRWAFLDHPGPIAFAHKGGAGDAPENTLPAFQHAVDLGYRYVETDVHVTADGVLVAFHDEVLDRVTDRCGRIDSLPWSEVRAARVHPPAGAVPVDAGIPLLEDLLGAWPQLRVNIDPKHDAAVAPLMRVLERAAALDRVCIGAFSDRRLARVRRLSGGRVCTSLGPAGTARMRAASLGMPTGRMAGACLQVPPTVSGRTLVDERFVRAAHRRGLPVHVWTIDEPVEIEGLLDLGVDGIMTDRLAILKDILLTRHQWSEI
jgi:glycerophosphoryl diester phosphodiesterase